MFAGIARGLWHHVRHTDQLRPVRITRARRRGSRLRCAPRWYTLPPAGTGPPCRGPCCVDHWRPVITPYEIMIILNPDAEEERQAGSPGEQLDADKLLHVELTAWRLGWADWS